MYTVQRRSDVDHRGMKMRWNNKLFPSLNVINGETFPYESKGILIHYHYRYDTKLGPGIFGIRIIPCSFYAYTAILSLSWDPKIKESVNHPRYGRVYNCRCSQILVCHHNWILMNFLDDVIDQE